MLYVLNEWVFHDLLGENGRKRFQETVSFVDAFVASGDQLVRPAEKRWLCKAGRLMRLSSPVGRLASKAFRTLLWDLNRTIHQNTVDLTSVPPVLAKQTPPEDLYLVAAYIQADADLLVTTDETLFNALANASNLNCVMRDPFLDNYVALNRIQGRLTQPPNS